MNLTEMYGILQLLLFYTFRFIYIHEVDISKLGLVNPKLCNPHASIVKCFECICYSELSQLKYTIKKIIIIFFFVIFQKKFLSDQSHQI